MGPVSYLIVEFPGNKMTGEGFEELVDLVSRGVIRILDLEFVTRADDGSITLPRPHIAPTFPVIGGGVHPGTVETYMGELGPDIILGAGGAIQGHPDGAAAGADAMRQAIDAVMAGQRVVDAAQEHPALARALERFGSTI